MEFGAASRWAPLPKFEVTTMHRECYHAPSDHTGRNDFHTIVNSPPRANTAHGRRNRGHHGDEGMNAWSYAPLRAFQ
eukprot:CAMPEP_0114621508 /NCGR_PEP_ID=MMETSP0168-20121206/9264_1 /TAXON_ID=95228 ORGANISM="Vannella sp., Strain DIVA3 517/6/12" /NCGR_SAMPLE_ID=MMETSP0168 /ASSEMBLY_ACC=CAM_ASM_000044 /LENGTH=76 /DNA_ID=CAMNT_0001832707 /DNA_START=28 /DNA_END=258 /DNA_ORIENTATION=+